MKLRQLIPLAAAAAILGKRRGGRRTHPSTLHRWARRGLRGVRLETVRVGGVVCTSVAALQRFFAALGARETSEHGGQTPAASVAPSTPSRCDSLIEAGLRARGLLKSKGESLELTDQSGTANRVAESARDVDEPRAQASAENKGASR